MSDEPNDPSRASARNAILINNGIALMDDRRRTTSVPVTTMEEVPVLSDSERAELAASLEAAEARLAAGHGIEHAPGVLRERLLRIFRAARR